MKITFSAFTHEGTYENPMGNFTFSKYPILPPKKPKVSCNAMPVVILKNSLGLSNNSKILITPTLCGPHGYASDYPIDAKIYYKNQEAFVTYRAAGGGSGGWLYTYLNVTIKDYQNKNKEIYQLLSISVCKQFENRETEGINSLQEFQKESPSEDVTDSMNLISIYHQAKETCLDKGFETVNGKDILISINTHSSRENPFSVSKSPIFSETTLLKRKSFLN